MGDGTLGLLGSGRGSASGEGMDSPGVVAGAPRRQEKKGSTSGSTAANTFPPVN
jgi:hypothetical protein